jgi:hypothetical protein
MPWPCSRSHRPTSGREQARTSSSGKPRSARASVYGRSTVWAAPNSSGPEKRGVLTQERLTLTAGHALDWFSVGMVSLRNRGNDNGKRQQFAEQGKEEAQESRGSEVDPGEVFPSAQETVTADRVCRTMLTQGWSSRQLVGLIPRSRGCESHPLRQLTAAAASNARASRPPGNLRLSHARRKLRRSRAGKRSPVTTAGTRHTLCSIRWPRPKPSSSFLHSRHAGPVEQQG